MHKEAKDELKIKLALAVLELANRCGVLKACWEFNIPRSTFFLW